MKTQDEMVIELLVSAGFVSEGKLAQARKLAASFSDVEPIPVSLLDIMDDLEKNEPEPGERWQQLRGLLETQRKVNSEKASALRSIPSELRSQRSRENGKKGGRPRKTGS
jgi:hypothetical protein